MQKFNLIRALLCVVLSLSVAAVVAQPRVITLDELFELAEENSKSIDTHRIALRASEAKLSESESQRLPDVEISASASYLGNGALTDRNWSNATNVKMPHFGNNFALEAEKLARSERLPSVALVAANHFDGPITIEVPTINKNFNYWYVGVGVSFKLSSLYKSNHKLRHQRIATAHSRRELDKLRDDVSLAVHADYIRYEEAELHVATMRKSVELA